MAYCRKNIAKYAMPYDIEFRSELPKTLVGKVAYLVLEKEETEKRRLQDIQSASALESMSSAPMGKEQNTAIIS